MVKTIGRALSKVLTFSGRDTRAQFWPYVGVLVALMFVTGASVMIPMMAGTFSKMSQFAAAHPDQAVVTRGVGSYSISIKGDHPELMPDVGPYFAVMKATLVALVALLAAAVTRRLHDRGKTGWWGLLPLPFLTFGVGMFPTLFASVNTETPRLDLLVVLFFNNVLYMVALVALVIMLAGPGTDGRNRFGEASTD